MDDDALLFKGSLHLSPETQVDGNAIVLSADTTLAGWRTGVFFIKHTLKRLLPPALIILVVIYLVRFQRRRRKALPQPVEAQVVSE